MPPAVVAVCATDVHLTCNCTLQHAAAGGDNLVVKARISAVSAHAALALAICSISLLSISTAMAPMKAWASYTMHSDPRCSTLNL